MQMPETVEMYHVIEALETLDRVVEEAFEQARAVGGYSLLGANTPDEKSRTYARGLKRALVILKEELDIVDEEDTDGGV